MKRIILHTNFCNPFLIFFAVSITTVLYLFRLSTQIDLPDELTSLYLLLSLFMLGSGIILGIKKIPIGLVAIYSSHESNINVSNRRFILYLVIFFIIISTAFFLFEHFIFYRKYGSIPILNNDFEILRMLFPISGYVHLIAMAGFTFLLYIYFECLCRKVNSSQFKSLYYFFIFFSILHIFLSLAVGNRGVIAFFFLQCFLVRSVFFKLPLFKCLLISFIFLYLIGAAKFYRDFIFLGDILFDDIQRVWFFGDTFLLIPLYYLYVTFTMNFEILNQYILSDFDFGLGYFTFALPFDSLFNGNAYELIDFQKDVLGSDFHGVLTATGFGVPFFDFGFFGVIVTLVLSYILGFTFYLVFIKGKIFLVPFYIYFFTTMLTFIYTYNFNKLYVVIYSAALVFICFFGRYNFSKRI